MHASSGAAGRGRIDRADAAPEHLACCITVEHGKSNPIAPLRHLQAPQDRPMFGWSTCVGRSSSHGRCSTNRSVTCLSSPQRPRLILTRARRPLGRDRAVERPTRPACLPRTGHGVPYDTVSHDACHMGGTVCRGGTTAVGVDLIGPSMGCWQRGKLTVCCTVGSVVCCSMLHTASACCMLHVACCMAYARSCILHAVHRTWRLACG
jgi:hypothetical protein